MATDDIAPALLRAALVDRDGIGEQVGSTASCCASGTAVEFPHSRDCNGVSMASSRELAMVMGYNGPEAAHSGSEWRLHRLIRPRSLARWHAGNTFRPDHP